MDKNNIGSRMKEFYEAASKTRLVRRTPVAVRLDGRSFHTFTKKFRKPFDRVLMNSMQRTMKFLCENIQGCVFGYTQSDEITLILIDYKNLDSSAWFDYEVQKICSISSSMATLAFNRIFSEEVSKFRKEYYYDENGENFYEVYLKAVEKGAMFDARAFNIPKEEVANLIYWRQLDAIRNSIQMAGQHIFSQKQLNGKSCKNILEMLSERGIIWSQYNFDEQRGAACFKQEKQNSNGYTWIIDRNIPLFCEEERAYIERFIFI